ncbi:YjjG family noncanonical pyrimidine nucleotidase [Lactobacillus sp. ESL0679]|uniref:YjjG family noncanonical pyrimidine nucleotidase n=1 Tax=Lactobacillus sp. ESL0679 TaxID=2983209 RepID=UPI0023F9BAC0|nr:YjjG family noncanonical pyrimidine nucleotidase [Lactobacillus sp. ESL0679]MDF7682492.1 YjjG family noncanonical pyrimidine nucleotidase [Lactobacillus sp. ESL0679]
MKYQQIIFDVDDTLIDSAATENFALHHLFAAHHWQLTPKLQQTYHKYNQGLWRQLELGEITYEELSQITFSHFLKANLGLEVDGLKIMNEYRSYFGEAHQLLPGVEHTLKLARKLGYQLTVLSNGERLMQNHRLELAGIKDYFNLIVTSQEAKVSKPDKRIFDYFFAQTKVAPNKTIFFGDGLQSDILGAEKYGFASIWYNHRHRANTLNLHPIFEVDTYQDFDTLLQNNLMHF